MSMPARVLRQFVFVFFIFFNFYIFIMAGVAANAAQLEPTFKDVSYGPRERDVLDFWKADSKKPTPLVIYIHGGGFIIGDKNLADEAEIKKCLANGISYVSIRYPFFKEVSLLEIIRDNIARSVQFLKYKSSDWNIDKTKIAVYGESAGAGSSLWIAFHDDLANQSAADPVLRESTRVAAAGAINTQATYDFPEWSNLFDNVVDKNTIRAWRLMMNQLVLDMYHLKKEKDLKTNEAIALRHELDMLSMIDKNDPPVILESYQSRQTPGDLLHHPRHSQAVKEKCDAEGAVCILEHDETPQDKRISVIAFLIEHISGK